MKIAWTNSRTKGLTAPIPNQPSAKSHKKYLKRSPEDESLLFLHWLCLYDQEKSPPKAYKGGMTLVAVIHLLPFNPLYFYQLLVMNFPHRSFEELANPRLDRLPEPIKFFVPTREKLPHILGSRDAILTYLSSESHKRSHVETFLHYFKSLEDLYIMWQVGVIDKTFASSTVSHFELQYPLAPTIRCVHKVPFSHRTTTK